MQGESAGKAWTAYLQTGTWVSSLFCQRSLAFGSSDLVVYMLGNSSADPGRFSSAILGEGFQSTCYGNESRNGGLL